MIFITNFFITNNYSFVINAYGDGPIRLLEKDIGTWQVVVVNNSEIIATLFEIDKTAVMGDQRNTPIYRVKDYR